MNNITGPLAGELSSAEVIALVDFGICPEGTTHWSALCDGRRNTSVWLQMGESGDVRILGDAPGFGVPIASPMPGQRHRQIVVRRPPSLIIPPNEQYRRDLENRERSQKDLDDHQADLKRDLVESAQDALSQSEVPPPMFWSCAACGDNFSYLISLLPTERRMVAVCTKCKAVQEELALGLIIQLSEEDEDPAPEEAPHEEPR